ncbi:MULTISPECIES: GreA/GreB family elongation factor [Burkholderiaceae]|uniref:GreA/GreB family elongation factor n=1 Tax=Burkholderiaceae TaxID=119060 RepID=UPI00095A15FA|nr:MULTISPECIES: GreA/GreB family elongation factor [Burkholderiaceae]MCF2135306.1 GreA/GreB family elongation factor [Mycetohabitans sp. B3]MCG1040866.1 GreA/GreB family elongation factor [Mycetohabitans sp. B7]SIT65220.1 regulator of nucleoside diphosphate kinase [Burkholderia sp. b14]
MKTCYLTETDVGRLERHAAKASPQSGYQAMLDALLERAAVVEATDIDPSVVTMNSTVTLSNPSSGERMTWTVVYPPNADFSQGRLNVFSPVGLALLGARPGDELRVTPPSGAPQMLKVEQIVFQPEAAGDYRL